MPLVTVEPRRPGLALAPIFAGVVLLMGLAVAFLHLDHLPFTICAFKTATGVPCMTCGTTRALGHLARLDPAAAFRLNPLTSTIAAATLAFGFVQLAFGLSGRRLRVSLPAAVWRGFWITLAVLALVNWVYLIRAGV